MKHNLVFFVLALGVTSSAFGQTPSATPTRTVEVSKPAPQQFSTPCAPVVDVCVVLDQYASLTHLKLIRDNFVQGQVCLSDLSARSREGD
jgi:hypothetical protein